MKKEEGDNSFGIASVVLGILSIVFSSASGIILGIVGLIFSLKQKKRMKNSWSKAGFILNIIGIILGIIILIYAAYAIANNPDIIAQFKQLANVQ